MMGAGSRLLCRGGGRKSLNVCNRVVAVVAGVGIPEFNRQVVAWNGMASLTCCEQGSCGPHNGEVYCQKSVTSLHCVVVDAVVVGCVGVRGDGVNTGCGSHNLSCGRGGWRCSVLRCSGGNDQPGTPLWFCVSRCGWSC